MNFRYVILSFALFLQLWEHDCTPLPEEGYQQADKAGKKEATRSVGAACGHCQCEVNSNGGVVQGSESCCSCVRQSCPCGTRKQWIQLDVLRIETCDLCGCGLHCSRAFDFDTHAFFCNCKTCFPSTPRVSLANGKSVRMSELEVGNQVLTVSADGTVKNSLVTTFATKVENSVSMYLSIITSSNKTISLTGNHLIYARNNSADKFSVVYADQVSIEDELLIQGQNNLAPTKIMKISKVKLQGAYAPLTMEGNIVVDGVLASCYASTDHDVSHFAMAPMRWFPEITEWIFGDDIGAPSYVNLAKDLRKLLPHV